MKAPTPDTVKAAVSDFDAHIKSLYGGELNPYFYVLRNAAIASIEIQDECSYWKNRAASNRLDIDTLLVRVEHLEAALECATEILQASSDSHAAVEELLPSAKLSEHSKWMREQIKTTLANLAAVRKS